MACRAILHDWEKIDILKCLTGRISFWSVILLVSSAITEEIKAISYNKSFEIFFVLREQYFFMKE